MEKKKIANNVLGGYIAFFILYSAAKRIVPFALFMEGLPNDIVYNIFVIVGLALLTLTLVQDKAKLKVFAWPVLLSFLFITIVSSLINIKYGYTKNMNIIVCGMVHYFLFFAYYKRVGKDEFFKNIRLTFDATLVFWVIATVVSFVQFYHLTAYRVVLDGVERRIGFFDNRLFGVFIDPNFAATVSLVLILAVILNFKHRTNFVKVWYVITVVINYSYIILSGSRAVEIAMYLVVLGGTFLGLYYHLLKKNKAFKTIAISAVVALVAVVLTYPIGTLTKKIWENVPVIEDATEKNAPYFESGEAIDKEEDISLERSDIDEENISNNRFDIWKSYIEVMKGKYIFGLSPRNAMPYATEHYPDTYMVVRNYSIHNGYLAVFAYTGVLGAVTMLIFLVLLVKRVLVYMFTNKNVSLEYVIMMLMVVALASYSFFFTEMFLINNFTSSLIWPIFGYLACKAKEE